MPSLGATEIIFPVLVSAMLAGIPAFVTWRRGGSTARVVATFVVGFVPYLGWLISWVLALTTKRERI